MTSPQLLARASDQSRGRLTSQTTASKERELYQARSSTQNKLEKTKRHWPGQGDGTMVTPSPCRVPFLPASECAGVRAVCENIRWSICRPPTAGCDIQGSTRPLCQENHLPVHKCHKTDPGKPLISSHSLCGTPEKAVL